MFYARSLSILGQNVDFCANQLGLSTSDILLSPVSGFINYALNCFHEKSVSFETLNSANLLSELLMVRDGLLEIPNSIINLEELQCLIEIVSVS